jgi:hypothetical protein
MRLFFIVLFFSSSFLRNANAQILYDASTQGTILKSLNLIYNYEFAESETLQKQIKAKYPNHPVVPLLRAIQLQWQYLPVKDIAIVHNFNSENLKAANEARKAYNYVMKGFDSMDKNPEFYFSTGMYNYYVERYPIDHPIVKPIMLFLKDGSMSLGLKQIETAATKSVFSRAESSFYVSRIYLKHEMKYDRAAMFMANLVKQYPNNMIYLMKYIEALLFAKKYDEAHRLNEILKTKQGTIYQLAAHVFEGIWQEKVEKNDQLATQSYQAAIKIPFDDEYTKDYHAFDYDGLSYIALRAKDSNKARIYLKKAQSLTSYEHIIRK